MSARSSTSGARPKPVPKRMHHRWRIRASIFARKFRVVIPPEVRAEVCTIERTRCRQPRTRRRWRHREWSTILIVSSASRRRPSKTAAEVEAPMIDHRRRKFALLGNRMHDVGALHRVSVRGARDVVDIEAGDRGGNDAPVAIEHRMMDQREEEIGHLRFRRRSRSGRRCSVRRRASASRHARILP